MKIDRRLIWIGMGLLTWALGTLMRLNPYFTEVVYARGLFNLLRQVYDFTLGWLPFAFLYLMLPLLLFWIGWRIKKWPPIRQWRRRRFFLNVGSVLAGIYILFYWLWGFNYYRRPVEDQLALPKIQLSEAVIQKEYEALTAELVQARTHITSDTAALGGVYIPQDLENHTRENLEFQLRTFGHYPTGGRVRVRRVAPEGLLMQLGASGIYIPFVGEGHFDKALAPVSVPFTMAHEMAHGYGFGDEGTCNFWAYLACMKSQDPFVQYAGLMGYWRYVASQYRRLNPDNYALQVKTLDRGVVNDLRSIRAVSQKYPGFFPEFSQKTYNAYLKQQGIKEGVVNYSKVVRMVMQWKARK
ncbi:MAG: DUF3810 domain-containing protein [Bacteroidota bacterium]